MSKSDENMNNIISLLDSESQVIKKINRSVTDSDNKILSKNNKAGISNLLNIYASVSGKSIIELEQEYDGKSYSEFKSDLSENIIELLKPIQIKYNEIISDKKWLEDLLISGSEKASYIARKTMSKVYRKVGFIKK